MSACLAPILQAVFGATPANSDDGCFCNESSGGIRLGNNAFALQLDLSDGVRAVRLENRLTGHTLELDGPELKRVADMAGDMVVTLGFCEKAGDTRYNAAVTLHGDGILGSYRKVHQPLGENLCYDAGDSYAAFDTPVGRMGMQICYDKGFPEAARELALDGAEIITSISAWPTARTATVSNMEDDRWKQRFDIYDRARALENQVIWVAANQAGTFGSLRFVCSAKIVGPGGEILAGTGVEPGLATATVDVAELIGAARGGGMYNLRDRRPSVYRTITKEPAHA